MKDSNSHHLTRPGLDSVGVELVSYSVRVGRLERAFLNACNSHHEIKLG